MEEDGNLESRVGDEPEALLSVEARDVAGDQFGGALRRGLRARGRLAPPALLDEDLRFSMPPQPGVGEGRNRVVRGWVDGGFGSESVGSMRCVVTQANDQPAVAAYVRPPGSDGYRPLALDVLRFEDGLVREIVTFDSVVRAVRAARDAVAVRGEQTLRPEPPGVRPFR